MRKWVGRIRRTWSKRGAKRPVVDKVRLGHLVICAGYRRPIINLKMISTLDAASGGRAELGLGAGWKEDDWRDYGYGFPTRAARLTLLEEHLEPGDREPGPTLAQQGIRQRQLRAWRFRTG